MHGLFLALLEELFMNKWLCLFILFLSALSFGQITVEVSDEQVYNTAMLGLRMRVVNNSGQSYDNVTVDFYLKKNPSETFALDSYYTEDWTISIAEQSGENVIIRATIPHLGAGTSPNSSGVSVGIHRTDWQPISKTSANGFPLGSTFTTALNYSVFQGNNLIGGTSYIDPNLIVPSLRFVGLQPEDVSRPLDEDIVVNRSAWIEIENYGTTPADLNNITIEWPTTAGIISSVVSSAMLQPGKRLRICTTQLNCPDDDVVAVVPTLPMGATGEVLLRYNGVAKDYLSWGLNADVLAANAREANIHYIKIRYDTGLPGYHAFDENWNELYSNNGVFYKKVDGTWFSYSYENDVNTTDRPAPIPYVNNEMLCIEGDNSSRTVRFAWHPVVGAVGYFLTVKRENGSTVFNQFVHRPFHDIVLDEDLYKWSVRVISRNDQYAVNNPWMDHYTIWKQKRVKKCSEITNQKELHVQPYGVHKDTRMLVPNWGELAKFPEISWDHPDIFVYNGNMDFEIRGTINDYVNPWNGNILFLEVDWRCWAVATQILNRFYHGNLTQDEIKYYGKTTGLENVTSGYGSASRPERDKIISPFVLGNMGGAYSQELIVVLKWALNLTDDSQLIHGRGYDEPFNQNFVMEHINQDRPIVYLQNGHFMVVDGYRFSSGIFQVHRVNIHNGGEVGWTDNLGFMGDKENYIAVDYYFVPINVTNPRMRDLRVQIDSDGDGLVDFDEIERFHTNPYNKDSDGDGIEDKVEIFSYTIKEEFEKVVELSPTYTRLSRLGDYDFYRNPSSDIYRTEVYADVDGDGVRAELDVDSDHPNNDGLWDGAEDLNHNGYVDNGETDPYNISDDYSANFNPVETVVWDAPSLVGIYAFEGINVRDNVTCNSGMHGFCQIASEYSEPYYSISVGANSTIGDVFSKGGVQLQNNAHVVGDASIYSLPTASISPNMYSGASVTGMTNVKNVGEWPYAVSDNLYHSLEGKENWSDMIVEFGQTVTLNSNIPYKNLIVRPGGTLKLGAGTIYVGNITLESGSKLEFVNPGRETVIIADGFLNWRAQIVNSDLQTVAKGFKLIEYAPGDIHIEGDWAGTIHARWCELTLGQVKKTAYGSFVAKKVNLGEGLTIYRIHFSPIPLTDMV